MVSFNDGTEKMCHVEFKGQPVSPVSLGGENERDFWHSQGKNLNLVAQYFRLNRFSIHAEMHAVQFIYCIIYC